MDAEGLLYKRFSGSRTTADTNFRPSHGKGRRFEPCTAHQFAKTPALRRRFFGPPDGGGSDP